MTDLERIKEFVGTELQAQLKMHGARCEVVGLADGVLTVKMMGGCSGCPSSSIALFNSISPILLEKFNFLEDILPS